MKIGILSGSFDPVHVGHVALALAAKEIAGLDEVYFAPEVKPRRKNDVTHISHRVAMLQLAVKPHKGLSVLEFSDRNFTPAKQLPKLKARFPDAKLYFICGADMLLHMPSWPLVDRLLDEMELIVSQRTAKTDVNDLVKTLPGARKVTIIKIAYEFVSSSAIREALLNHREPTGLLKTTEGYIKKHWLYAPLFSPSSKS